MIFSGCCASFNWVSILLQDSLRSLITLLGKRLCLQVSHLYNFIDSWEPITFHLLSRAGVGWGDLLDLLCVGLGDLLLVGFSVSPAQRTWLLLEDGFRCCHVLLVWTSLLIRVVIWNDDDLIELNRRLYTLTGGRGSSHRVLLVEPVSARAQIPGGAPQANRVDLRRCLAACPATFPLGYSPVDEQTLLLHSMLLLEILGRLQHFERQRRGVDFEKLILAELFTRDGGHRAPLAAKMHSTSATWLLYWLFFNISLVSCRLHNKFTLWRLLLSHYF